MKAFRRNFFNEPRKPGKTGSFQTGSGSTVIDFICFFVHCRTFVAGNLDRDRRGRGFGPHHPPPDPLHPVRRQDGEVLLRAAQQEEAF